MASKGQLTGMTGTFLVAAQLSDLGFTVSTTSRGAAGADILVTDDACRVAYSVQVKSNAKKSNAWLLGNKEPPVGTKTHLYAFVNLTRDNSGVLCAEYFLVPSTVVRKIAIRANKDNAKIEMEAICCLARPYREVPQQLERS
jgi:hypothetical protein